jgi:outer membrane protein OmpU
MKNKLLTGAAIIGAMLSSSAYAADTDEGIKLNLGGYFKAYTSYVDQDHGSGAGAKKVDILRTTEVHFDGKTKLNNGMTVGAHIEGQADGGDDFFVDESYIFFSGAYGKVNLGRTYGTPYILQVVAPAADSNIDGRIQLVNPINLTVSNLTTALKATTYETDYDQDVSAKVDKFSYITPLFSGLQLGVSYTPDGSTTSRGLTGNATTNDASQRSNILEGAVRYENKDSKSFDYALGAGYSKAQAEVTTASFKDREAWNVGADFNIGKFGIGATYQVDDTGAAAGDMKYSVVGADYTEGKLVYGASYYNKNDDVNNADINRYSAGITYKAIPGLSFRGSAHYYDISQGATNFNATALLLGTDIKF